MGGTILTTYFMKKKSGWREIFSIQSIGTPIQIVGCFTRNYVGEKVELNLVEKSIVLITLDVLVSGP